MNCNGFVYEHENKTCFITSELYASQEQELVYRKNYDFFQRRRCEGMIYIISYIIPFQMQSKALFLLCEFACTNI